eukprot:262078-Rhodomonas_salina.1
MALPGCSDSARLLLGAHYSGLLLSSYALLMRSPVPVLYIHKPHALLLAEIKYKEASFPCKSYQDRVLLYSIFGWPRVPACASDTRCPVLTSRIVLPVFHIHLQVLPFHSNVRPPPPPVPVILILCPTALPCPQHTYAPSTSPAPHIRDHAG